MNATHPSMRRPTLFLLALLATLAAAVSPAAAQNGQGPQNRPDAQNVWGSIVVEPAQLLDALDDSSLVVLHFGNEESYLAGHIPGAVLASENDLLAEASVAAGLTRELPAPARLQANLRALGIDDDSRILIYHAAGGEPNLTRMLFTLDWAGLGDRTAAMLGGIEGWTAAGGEIEASAAAPPTSAGQVTVRPRDDVVVTADQVAELASTPGQLVIDAREPEFYAGEREDRGAAGHVPGSASLPHRELFTEARSYRSLDELGALFEAAGASPGDRIIAYCHVGFYATTIVTAARLLGYEAVMYDGSWEEWAASGREVETP